MKLLGIDYGTKRLGLALADSETGVATPHDIIANDDAVNTVAQLCEERDVDVVVVGESKRLSGADNPVMKQIRSFVQALEERISEPVEFMPEFFTSAQARRQPEAAQNVDGSAAAIILQSYLDNQPHEDRQ